MAILATVQLAVRFRASVLLFQYFRLAVEGELWPTSARAVSVSNELTILYDADDFLLVTNK